MRTSRVVALALLVGAFFTAEEVFMDLAAGRPVALVGDLWNGLAFWVVWVFLAPLVLVALRRWPVGAKPVSHPLLVHAGVAVSLSALHNVLTLILTRLVMYLQGAMSLTKALTRTSNPVAFVWGVFTGVIFYALIVMVYGAAALEAELTRSKLETLRSQLRPHFLFNTLNAISVLLTEDAGKAQRMILRLSTLLRRSLDEEAHEVSLRQELAFVNDYLDIQRGRFDDRLEVRLAIDPTVLDARVPVFLLQPLLENAIEHRKSVERCLAIALNAGRERDMLRITVADDGPGTLGAPVRERIGLGNTRARLLHLYGPRASVELGDAHENAESHGTRVEIRIPYRDTAE